jgi:hypothetical protein
MSLFQGFGFWVLGFPAFGCSPQSREDFSALLGIELVAVESEKQSPD